MTLQRNIVLAVVFAIICALIFQVEIPRDEKEKSRGVLFSGLMKSAIQKVEITGSKGNVVLSNATSPEKASSSEEITSKSWRYEGAEWTEVNSGTVGTLLSSLLSLKLDSPIPANETESDRSIYGLTQPETTVKVTAQGKVTKILLGKMNKYVSKRYVAVSGEPSVYLITDSLSGAVNHEERDFRNTKPISFSDSDVSNITISRKGSTAKLTYLNGVWRIESPIAATGGKKEVSDFLSNLKSLTASQFLNGSESEKLGLGKPDATVTVNFTSKETQPLVISVKAVPGEEIQSPLAEGKKTKGVDQAVFTIAGQPGVFKTSENATAKFSADIDTLRERELFKFDTFEVQSIQLKHSQEETIDLARSNNEWTINNEKGDATFIDQLSQDLAALKAESFPKTSGANDEAYGFNKPTFVAKVTLKTAVAPEGEEKGTLQTVERTLYVGAKVNNGSKVAKKGKEKEAASPAQYYAAIGDRLEPFIISQESFKKISPHKETLVKIEMASPSPTPK